MTLIFHESAVDAHEDAQVSSRLSSAGHVATVWTYPSKTYKEKPAFCVAHSEEEEKTVPANGSLVMRYRAGIPQPETAS